LGEAGAAVQAERGVGRGHDPVWAKFQQCELRGRVLDGFHYFLDRKQVDRAGLLVQLGDIMFIRAIVLARHDQQRVLYGIDNDLCLDAFFLTQ
jgi:hypothetical protein